MSYMVVYFKGYAGPRRKHPTALRVRRIYRSISEACKARDRVFDRGAGGRWPVTEAYICSAVRGVQGWTPFCRLNLAVRTR